MKKIKNAESIYNYIEKIIPNIQFPLIFEIGAHDGGDTIRILKYCTTNPRYYAIEPDPRTFSLLKRQKRAVRINTFNIAISNFDGRADFYLSDGNPPNRPSHYNHTASSTLIKPKEDKNSWLKFTHARPVDVFKLDTLCGKHKLEFIDFIWADMEGSEGTMIEGGQDILKKTKFLYMEYQKKVLKENISKLPGKWKIIHKFENDVLLENVGYIDDRYKHLE